MSVFFFFNDTATTEIYTLSLHDALPILALSLLTVLSRLPFRARMLYNWDAVQFALALREYDVSKQDRKSTRLNSSHANISYAVFCLKKKNYADGVRHFRPDPPMNAPCHT